MICIEEWGHEPECAAPVESAALDPVSTGSFAFRLRFGAPFARENGVGGVGRRLDVAVTQIAAADADLERNNRIYFTRSRGFLLSSVREREKDSWQHELCVCGWLDREQSKERASQARILWKNSLFRTCCVSTGMQPTEAGPHSALLTQLLLTWNINVLFHGPLCVRGMLHSMRHRFVSACWYARSHFLHDATGAALFSI